MAKHSNTAEALPKLIIVVIILACIAVAVTAAVSIKYLKSHSEESANNEKLRPTLAVDTRDCNAVNGKNYTVVIENNRVNPSSTNAKLCDTITFVNNDAYRLFTFGVHDQHITYNGITEKGLEQGESFTIMLDAEGTVPFHDHDQEEVAGTFSVTAN